MSINIQKKILAETIIALNGKLLFTVMVNDPDVLPLIHSSFRFFSFCEFKQIERCHHHILLHFALKFTLVKVEAAYGDLNAVEAVRVAEQWLQLLASPVPSPAPSLVVNWAYRLISTLRSNPWVFGRGWCRRDVGHVGLSVEKACFSFFFQKFIKAFFFWVNLFENQRLLSTMRTP